MPTVTYRLASGEARRFDIAAGQSVMQGAVAHAIPGIVAECGGSLTCATCHVHLAPDWYERFPPPESAERDLLEIVDEPTAGSRLSCQLIVTAAMDGLDVVVPK
jgi:2Fe-2S ferredoxin